MIQLMRTAAYVRRKPTTCGKRSAGCVDPRWVAERLNIVDRKIWHHLQTPQTLDSLTNAITGEPEFRSRSAATEVEMALRRFLERDLIELSPEA
jgi:hypothetical protein